MRKQTLTALPRLCLLASLLASLVSGDIGDSGGEDECPLRLTSVEVLVGLIRCPLCNCHQVLLDGETVLYKVTPETPVMSVVVGNDLSIQGGGGVALSIGSSAAQGGITVNKGFWLKFVSIFLVTDLVEPEAKSFLLPDVVQLSQGASVVLEDVDILTSDSVVEEYIDFAKSSLEKDTYEVVEFPVASPLLQYLVVKSWTSKAMQASHVVVTTIEQPKLVMEGDNPVLGVSHSKGLLGALDIVEETNETRAISVANSLILVPGDWPFARATVTKNITISGLGADTTFLDLSFVQSAVVVQENAHVDITGVEFVHLATNEDGASTFDAIKLFFFALERQEVINVHVRDSRMVISCEEYAETERAISMETMSSNSSVPSSIALQAGGLHILSHIISQKEGNMAGYIKLQEAHGHGVSYENVVIMCDDNRHSIVKTPSLEPEEDHIPAPQALARPEANVERITSGFTPGRPRHGFVEEETSTDETIIIFKVILALLIPTFVILGAAFLWKLQKVRVKVNDVYSHENPKSTGMTGGVTSKGGGSRKGPVEEMPATSSSDRATGLSSGKFSSAWDVRKNHAAEFIPDILAVAENIDDKQLVLQELLGQGSSGTVHKGLWRELSVAVKTIVFRGNQRDSQERQQAAIREVAITSGLTHPNVICTYSYDIKRLTSATDNKPVEGTMGIWDDFSDWKLYIIQEFCDGGSLRKGLGSGCLMDKKNGGPELEKDLEIASGIARGVHHIHTKNIIHGDLKPSNVLLKRTDKSRSGFIAKIADFGLSLKMHGSQTHVSNVQGGTPFYMAPEVLELGNASKAADVYAFGVMLWEIYMSHFSSTGVPSPHALSHFPTFPWSCPVLYGVLSVSCVHQDPCQRPSFQDILDVLSLMWQQMRQKMMVSPTQPRGSGLDCGMPQMNEDLQTARATFNENIVVMPSKFRELNFQEVYWTNDRH